MFQNSSFFFRNNVTKGTFGNDVILKSSHSHVNFPSPSLFFSFHPFLFFSFLYFFRLIYDHDLHTAISRKVVGKKYARDNPKGNKGYDQFTVPDTVAFEPTFVTFLEHLQTYVHGLSCHFLKFLWRTVNRLKNHPQYLSGLSPSLFPTTFLEIAVCDIPAILNTYSFRFSERDQNLPPKSLISCSLDDLEAPYTVNRLNHFWPLSNNCWTMVKKYYDLSLTIRSDVLPIPIRERQILDLWKTDIKNSLRPEWSNCQYFCFVFDDMLVKRIKNLHFRVNANSFN